MWCRTLTLSFICRRQASMKTGSLDLRLKFLATRVVGRASHELTLKTCSALIQVTPKFLSTALRWARMVLSEETGQLMWSLQWVIFTNFRSFLFPIWTCFTSQACTVKVGTLSGSRVAMASLQPWVGTVNSSRGAQSQATNSIKKIRRGLTVARKKSLATLSIVATSKMRHTRETTTA